MAAAQPVDAQDAGAGVHGIGTAEPLTDRDARILNFERQWWKYAGAKEDAVRELFSLSSTEYYQILNAIIDQPAALERDPMLVKRLRRMRATRQRGRGARSWDGAN